MLSESLTKRERLVLEALVRAYVDLRTPVGSRTILVREGFEFSPATMRKTLSSLERKGLVQQPHTSAGRLPTDEGYRFFVDEGRMQTLDITPDELESLRSSLEEAFQQVRADEIHAQLAAILGDVSNQLGLALAPRFEQAVFRKLELVRLTSQQLLLVATLGLGPVQSLVVEVDSEGLRGRYECGQTVAQRASGRSHHERDQVDCERAAWGHEDPAPATAAGRAGRRSNPCWLRPATACL